MDNIDWDNFDCKMNNKLWLQLEPSDFYFQWNPHEWGIGCFHIEPKKHYDKERCLFDQELYIDHLLDGLDLYPEDCARFEKGDKPTVDEIRLELIKRGFTERDMLTEIVGPNWAKEEYEFDEDTDIGWGWDGPKETR
jgi:hypothetical protein